MTQEVSSGQTQPVEPQEQGVAASTPDTNNWEQIARTAQSGNDQFTALKSKFGDNVDEQLQNLADFQAQLNDNPQTAIDALGVSYGITQKQQQPDVSTGNDRMNPFDIDVEGSYSNKKINSMFDVRLKKALDDRFQREEGLRKLNSMRDVLNANGITDPKQQEKEIERYYRPQVDFKTYAESRKPQLGTQTGAIQQVQQTQGVPQTASVLPGLLEGGIPTPQTDAEAEVNEVMKYAKEKSNAQMF